MAYEEITAEELIRVCVENGQPAAWEEFVLRFHPVISSVAVKIALRWGETSPAVVDDLVQEIHLKVCENDCELLRKFESRHPGSIFGYIKVVAANIVHDYFKAAHAQKRGADSVCQSVDSSDVAAPPRDSDGAEAIERNVLIGEIEAALNRVAGGPGQQRNRTIFWLYYRQGLTAEDIGSLPFVQMNTKGVESAILRLTRLVRETLMSQNRVQAKANQGKGIQAVESL